METIVSEPIPFKNSIGGTSSYTDFPVTSLYDPQTEDEKIVEKDFNFTELYDSVTCLERGETNLSENDASIGPSDTLHIWYRVTDPEGTMICCSHEKYPFNPVEVKIKARPPVLWGFLPAIFSMKCGEKSKFRFEKIALKNSARHIDIQLNYPFVIAEINVLSISHRHKSSSIARYETIETIKKRAGSVFNTGDWEEALHLYKSALVSLHNISYRTAKNITNQKYDLLRAKLISNSSQCLLKLRKSRDALAEIDEFYSLLDQLLTQDTKELIEKTLYRECQAYSQLGDYEGAFSVVKRAETLMAEMVPYLMRKTNRIRTERSDIEKGLRGAFCTAKGAEQADNCVNTEKETEKETIEADTIVTCANEYEKLVRMYVDFHSITTGFIDFFYPRVCYRLSRFFSFIKRTAALACFKREYPLLDHDEAYAHVMGILAERNMLRISKKKQFVASTKEQVYDLVRNYIKSENENKVSYVSTDATQQEVYDEIFSFRKDSDVKNDDESNDNFQKQNTANLQNSFYYVSLWSMNRSLSNENVELFLKERKNMDKITKKRAKELLTVDEFHSWIARNFSETNAYLFTSLTNMFCSNFLQNMILCNEIGSSDCVAKIVKYFVWKLWKRGVVEIFVGGYAKARIWFNIEGTVPYVPKPHSPKIITPMQIAIEKTGIVVEMPFTVKYKSTDPEFSSLTPKQKKKIIYYEHLKSKKEQQLYANANQSLKDGRKTCDDACAGEVEDILASKVENLKLDD